MKLDPETRALHDALGVLLQGVDQRTQISVLRRAIADLVSVPAAQAPVVVPQPQRRHAASDDAADLRQRLKLMPQSATTIASEADVAVNTLRKFLGGSSVSPPILHKLEEWVEAQGQQGQQGQAGPPEQEEDLIERAQLRAEVLGIDPPAVALPLTPDARASLEAFLDTPVAAAVQLRALSG